MRLFNSTWPSYSDEECKVVSDVLGSNRVNYWTGDLGEQFESEFANFVGVKNAVALSNGTLALELALKALRVGQGDEVIVSPRSFYASAASVCAVGAVPVFADVDIDLQSISATTVEPLITANTRAILVVHLAGIPADMDDLMSLAQIHGLHVIEDCAQAHGATYKNQSLGSIGSIGAWSFCQDKIMTTGGEGGMITTNSDELWEKVWSLKDHGKSYKKTQIPSDNFGFKWLHDSFGTNARMLELQAAIGLIQLKKLESWLTKRRANCSSIWSTCEKLAALRVPVIPGHMEHAGYKCYVFVKPELLKSGWTRDRIIAGINELGVPAFSGSCPEIYLEKAFEGMNCVPKERLPVARELGETSLMFLVHPTLTDYELSRTCSAIEEVVGRATKGS